MIHPLYAFPTYSTMMKSGFFNKITFETIANLIQQLNFFPLLLYKYILTPLCLLLRQLFFISLSNFALCLIYSNSSL